MTRVRYFEKNNIEPDKWPRWQKKTLTRAVRVQGPFVVINEDHGEIPCDDGYIAVDEAGNPYPITLEQFHKLYGPQSLFNEKNSSQERNEIKVL